MADSGGCTIVVYHYVRDTAATAFPEIKGLHPTRFEQQLDWLQEHYDVLDYPRFERAFLDAPESLASTALLTFDDGLVDHYEVVYPILKRRGLSGLFFVLSRPLRDPVLANVHKAHLLLASLGAGEFDDAIRDELATLHFANGVEHFDREALLYRYDGWGEKRVKTLLNYELPFHVATDLLSRLFERHIGSEADYSRDLYLSADMIQEMAQGGMTFGGHTENHFVLSRLDADAQRAELEVGIARVRELTGQASVPFCYPYGHPNTFNAATLDTLDVLGYSTAFTTARELEHGQHSRFEISRFDTNDVYPHVNGAGVVASPATERA